jgi:hypothetical protein
MRRRFPPAGRPWCSSSNSNSKPNPRKKNRPPQLTASSPSIGLLSFLASAGPSGIGYWPGLPPAA